MHGRMYCVKLSPLSYHNWAMLYIYRRGSICSVPRQPISVLCCYISNSLQYRSFDCSIVEMVIDWSRHWIDHHYSGISSVQNSIISSRATCTKLIVSFWELEPNTITYISDEVSCSGENNGQINGHVSGMDGSSVVLTLSLRLHLLQALPCEEKWRLMTQHRNINNWMRHLSTHRLKWRGENTRRYSWEPPAWCCASRQTASELTRGWTAPTRRQAGHANLLFTIYGYDLFAKYSPTRRRDMLIYVDIYIYLADVEMHCIINYMRRHETHVQTHFAQ